MLEPTIVRQKGPDLNGMVWCNTCNIAMGRTGGEYSCDNAGDGKCYTPSIAADELLTRVITKLVDRMVASGADARFMENLQETISPAAETQVNRRSRGRAQHNNSKRSQAEYTPRSGRG